MREQDRERQKREWENKERQAEEFRVRDEQEMRRTQEGMQLRMQKQDEEMRRRQQENSLFMQAQQLNNMLDQQEMSHGPNPGGNNAGGIRKNFNDGNDNRRNFDMMNQGKKIFVWIRMVWKLLSFNRWKSVPAAASWKSGRKTLDPILYSLKTTLVVAYQMEKPEF